MAGRYLIKEATIFRIAGFFDFSMKIARNSQIRLEFE